MKIEYNNGWDQVCFKLLGSIMFIKPPANEAIEHQTVHDRARERERERERDRLPLLDRNGPIFALKQNREFW